MRFTRGCFAANITSYIVVIFYFNFHLISFNKMMLWPLKVNLLVSNWTSAFNFNPFNVKHVLSERPQHYLYIFYIFSSATMDVYIRPHACASSVCSNDPYRRDWTIPTPPANLACFVIRGKLVRSESADETHGRLFCCKHCFIHSSDFLF